MEPEPKNPKGNLESAGDPYHLFGSDHPGMQLTIKQFNGMNYQNWSKSARMALGAKSKLGFVDGTIIKPAEGTNELQSWLRCDYMVRCWLLNSITSEIADSFMYVESAKNLWDELAERFGEANGPLIYQLHRDLTLLSQENDPLSLYFSKMKKLWDELQDVDAILVCSCGTVKGCKCGLIKKLQERDSRNKLIQFLMGLNSGYDNMKGQILAMDPLPTVNRAYYIIQQIEKQKQVAGIIQNRQEVEAYAAQKQNPRTVGRKDLKRGKNDRYCDHCKVSGHLIDQCFKLHGYPDWYKEKFGSKMKIAANVESQESGFDTPFDRPPEDSNVDNTLVNIVCQEVLKALQNKSSSNGHAHVSSNSVSNALSGALLTKWTR